MPLRHPHAATLELLALALEKLPPTFSEASRAHYEERLQAFLADPTVSYESIHETLVALGKESWPFRRAFEEMYDRYGRASEEAHLLENLDAGVRGKYERFLHEGGKINHIEAARSGEELHAPSPFESYFDPEEKFAVQQALVEARVAARREIGELVTTSKKEEYGALVSAFGEEQRHLESALGELRALSAVSRKWRPEMANRLRTLEEGWSVVEKPLSLAEAQHEVEYWKGTLEAFLPAA
jgi:hypothetical protein